jgi:Zn-finger nucleic acid-binding protein
MPCPNCDEDLKIADRQGIEIDYCSKCRGVWLDRGELDKIIERSADFAPQSSLSEYRTYPEPDDRPDYRDHPQHDRGDYRHKKKKSLLGELFDF